MKNSNPGIIDSTNIVNASGLNFKYKAIICLGARGGGGGSESTDRQVCAILALEVVPQNLIFE